MLYLFFGTDRERARVALNKQIDQLKKEEKTSVIRISDAHTPADVLFALQGGGMFGGKRVVIFENILSNDELAPLLKDAVPSLKNQGDHFFLLEDKIDAVSRKTIEKYTEISERFDAEKKFEDKTAFGLASALKRRDKKALWIGYLRELEKGNAPEMLHGILFWAAKSMVLSARVGSKEQKHAQALVASLAELPHESRRRGMDMESALESFVLSIS